MEKSRYENDHLEEQEVSKFLDKHFYSRPEFTKKLRTYDKDEQFNGSDIVVSIKSNSLNLDDVIIDEKAQITAVGKPLPSFSLELNSFGKKYLLSEGKTGKEGSTGWFINPNKKTQFYLFIWIDKATEDYVKKDGLKETQIKQIDYALVSRKKLFNYFESYGYNVDRITRIANEIRNGNYGSNFFKTGGGVKIITNPDLDFWFYLTEFLPEKPINLILRKKVYLRLADMSGTITV